MPPDLLVIENVGNLVCTAGFDLGEHLRIVVLSVSEGDDKLAKYPAIFRGSDAVLITKCDLLSATNFKPDRVCRRATSGPRDPRVPGSALCGDGIAELADWLIARIESPSKVNN